MKDFIGILRRFIPPYKKDLIFNIIHNIFGTIFGIFSFVLVIPLLGILFNQSELVEVKPIFDGEHIKESVEAMANYYISQVKIHQGDDVALIFVCGFLVLTVLLKVAFTYLASYHSVSIRNGVVRDIRKKIYHKIVSLPLGFFTEERKGDIISRTTGDVQEVENSVMTSLDMFFKNPVIMLITIIGMIVMNWQMTIFVFILMPIAGIIIGSIGKSLKKPSRRGQDKMGELLNTIEETLSGLRVIKAFNAERKMGDRFDGENTEYRRIMNSLMRRRVLAHPVSELLGTIVIVILLWYGGRLILSEESSLSAAQFIAFLILFYSIINPAKAFSNAFYSIQKGLAAMDRIDDVLDAVNTIEEKVNAQHIETFEKGIAYNDVTFSYARDNVLKNVALEVPKGKMVALVGQSGSGKTTFVDMLPRFYDIQSGSITVDGIDIRDLKMTSLRGLIGYVNQEPILFNDTFYNNIAFGVEEATKEEVITAAKVANAHQFIMETEGGYDANIGDRGSKLSGGQRQRISIARAVLKNPPILILDEATSALDTESEKLVQEALEKLMKDRTSIVIAHRLSTIRNADLICVFKGGEIVERGTHDDLLKQGGVYKRLHQMQVF